MASPNHTVVVSVLGLSRLDGESFGSHKGIGKSCLCSRFMYSGYDDYQHDSHSHCSLLALHEFESDVVHKDPFLYWGSMTKTYMYGAKDLSKKVHFEVLEHTVFYQDITDRPFRINSSKKSITSLNDYVKVALASTLDSSGKLSYKNRDLICAPQDYKSVPFPPGIAKHKRGFVVVIDVSDNGPTFDSRLHQTEKIVAHLASRKQKFVVAATKTDEAFATSLEKLSELARTRKFTLIEVSAKANVNVSEAFEIVAAKVLHKSKTINGLPTHVLSYSDAANKTLSTLDQARRSFRTYLQKRVTVSSESLKTLERTDEYKTCAHLHGMFETNKMFAHHILTLRNDEVSTYAEVMDSEEMRQKFLEDYLAERKDLSPHAKYLKELIIKVCQMCSRRASMLLSPTPPPMPSEIEISKNNLTFAPSPLTLQQDSNKENYRPLPPVPSPKYDVNLPLIPAVICEKTSPPMDITIPASPSLCQTNEPIADGWQSKEAHIGDLIRPKSFDTGCQKKCDIGDCKNLKQECLIPDHMLPSPQNNLFPGNCKVVKDYCSHIPGTISLRNHSITSSNTELGGSGVYCSVILAKDFHAATYVNIPMSAVVQDNNNVVPCDNSFNMVPGENLSEEELHSHSVYDFISDGEETQELDEDVWYAEIGDRLTDVCSSESDEVGTEEGQGEADNRSYVYVRMNTGLNNDIALSDSDDEYVNIAGTEMNDEDLDMVYQTTQPTAPLHQSSPQLHQPLAQLQPLSAKLHQPLSEIQEPSSPHNSYVSLQQPCLQLQQPTQGKEEEEGRHKQPLLTQGTPIALLDLAIVGPGTSSLSRLGGADQLGDEGSLTSLSSQPKKSPPQVLKEKPLPLQTWTVSLVQPDAIITSPDNGRSVQGNSKSDEVKIPVGCSLTSKSTTEENENMTSAAELGASRAIPVLATAPTVMLSCTTPVEANNKVGRKVETPGLDMIRKKLQKVGPLRESRLDSSMSPLPCYDSAIPAGDITCNQCDNDLVLCKKCSISWVPLEKSCLSEVKPHPPICQICALCDFMSNNDAEHEEDGKFNVISNNPMDMCPHVNNKEDAKEGQNDKDNGSYLYMLNNSCVENDIAGSYSDEYVAITRMGVEDHDYVNTSEILGLDLGSVDASQSLQTSAPQQQPLSQLQKPSPQRQQPLLQLQQSSPQEENEMQEKGEQPPCTQGNTPPTLTTFSCFPDPTAIPLSLLRGAEEQCSSTQLSSQQIKKTPPPLKAKPLISKRSSSLNQSDIDDAAPSATNNGRNVNGASDTAALEPGVSQGPQSQVNTLHASVMSSVIASLVENNVVDNQVKMPVVANIRDTLEKETNTAKNVSLSYASLPPATLPKPDRHASLMMSQHHSKQALGTVHSENKPLPSVTSGRSSMSSSLHYSSVIPAGVIHANTSVDAGMSTHISVRDDFGPCNNICIELGTEKEEQLDTKSPR